MSRFSYPLSRASLFQLDRRAMLVGALAGSAGLTLSRSFAQTNTALARKPLARSESDPAELQVLRDAIAELKKRDGAVPAADGWVAIAEPHVLNCFTGDAREIHFGWWFLPWHRAYLIAMERRLQHVAREPKLRLPYWNWFDVDDIPQAFAREKYSLAGGVVRSNPLFDATRAQSPADRAAIFRGPNGIRITRSVRGNYDSELDLLRPAQFTDIGGGLRNAAGAIETGPHNPIHVWVGGTHDALPGRPGSGGNMGQEFSPRDPVFLLHHGNIDRLWVVWTTLSTGGAHRNPTDQSWLQREFPLPHHTGVGTEAYKVADLLDPTAWGYSYDEDVIAVASSATAEDVGLSAAATSFVMNDGPLDLRGGIAHTQVRERPVAPAAAASSEPRSGIVRLRATVPPGNLSMSVYLNSPDDQVNSESNLVGIATILDPTGRSQEGRKEVGLVIPVPDRILQMINERTEFSFSVVPSSAKGEGPAAAAAGAFDGASVLELKLELQ